MPLRNNVIMPPHSNNRVPSSASPRVQGSHSHRVPGAASPPWQPGSCSLQSAAGWTAERCQAWGHTVVAAAEMSVKGMLFQSERVSILQ